VAFGFVVRWYREERGWSQELAHAADLHPKYVGTIERGERSPTLPTILKLSDALEMPAGRLLDATQRFMADGAPPS
jgi:transcriptional regulator with XRE-family HTH domain